MDAGELFTGASLDWVKVTRLLRENFQLEDAELLYHLYGLEGYDQASAKELRKQTKLKKKAHEEKMFKLQKKLFHLLKDEDQEELFIGEDSQEESL
ncbi:MAG: hypothetical protein GX046_10345 [Tissierellia bacterium]|nr:hypothetical protein [Tissierellia bacterium]